MSLAAFVNECGLVIWSDTDEAAEAANYLTEIRGLTPETVRDHGLGFCPSEGSLVRRHFPPKTHRFNSIMKGRITVPICSEFGVVQGVAVRSYNPKEKGWWNTRFDKAKHLFLFDKARESIYRQNKAYVFEGYMDGLCLFQEGLTNSVVMMGTNLGLRKISLLARYCDCICLCFDNDPNDAGLLGQYRTLADLNLIGFKNVYRINMPATSVDPDEFVLEHGIDGFLDLEKKVTSNQLVGAKGEYLKLREANREKGNKT